VSALLNNDSLLLTALTVLVSCLAIAGAYGFWAFGQRILALEVMSRRPKPLPPGSPEHLTTVFRNPLQRPELLFSGERREG
jgi:hypothetical protein